LIRTFALDRSSADLRVESHGNGAPDFWSHERFARGCPRRTRIAHSFADRQRIGSCFDPRAFWPAAPGPLAATLRIGAEQLDPEDPMTFWRPDDWDGSVPPEFRAQLLRPRAAGQSEPVVLLASPDSASGAALLAHLGRPGFRPGDRTPLLVASSDHLSELLDDCFGSDVGPVVMGVRLREPQLVRGVLVLPETIEILALAPEFDGGEVWPIAILDLAAQRMHLRDEGRESWQSFDVVHPSGTPGLSS
jgi:hypothetical protein